MLVGAGSLSPGGVNRSREVKAGFTGGWMAASTWGGGLPEGEEMPRIKKSLSSTIDGHSSAMPRASSEDISTVILEGKTSWGGWKTSWLAVSTVDTEVLTNDTGLDGSSGAMKASSWGGRIEVGSSCSERPGGSGIVTREQRSYGSREQLSPRDEEKKLYPATCKLNVERFIRSSLRPYEPVDVWQVERSVQYLCPFRQILLHWPPPAPLPDTNFPINLGIDQIGGL